MRRFFMLVAAAMAVPAAAQPASYEGSLSPCADHQQLRLEGGQRYAISVSSDAFDPVARLYRAGSDSLLVEDDDSGEGNNALLYHVPAETGDYRVCVSSFGGSGAGAYRIDVAEAEPLPAATTRPSRSVQVSQKIFEGSLDRGDPLDGELRFDDFEIELQPGGRALIGLESDAFDPILKIYRAEARGGEPIATDDDSGGGLDSFLVLHSEEGGRFIVRASTFAAETGGAYRLTIQD